MLRDIVCVAGFAACSLVAASALAEDAPAAGTPPAPSAAPSAAPAAAPAAPAKPAPAVSEERKDEVRFRGGISAGGGGLFVSNFSAVLGGIDGHLGVQINNLIAVYAAPHLSLGTGKVGNNIEAFTGSASAALMVDFTFIDHVFVGVGGGAGAVGALGGPEIQFRVGGYPYMTFANNGIRRKGLMLGADLRLYFLEGGGVSATVMQAMGSIGYEAF